MIIVALVLLGLCMGSFVNALVWRLRQQDYETTKKKPDRQYLKQLSIARGRSMCPHCQHELAVRDLIPVFSWLALKGKCRYCRKPISAQYPIVEALTAGLFVASYLWWPQIITGSEILVFGLWLAILTGFIALIIYDLRWMILPDRLVFALVALGALLALINIVTAVQPLQELLNIAAAVLVSSGLFFVLFQLSDGKWIGGGDVKLGLVLGLTAGTPGRSFLLIFLAALLGSLVAMPLLLNRRLKSSSHIPFGPFLIIAAIIVQLFGSSLISWYQQLFLS